MNPQSTPELPPETTLAVLADAISDIEKILADFRNRLGVDTNLTGRERNRLFSARARNYGFVTSAYDIARENPHFVPQNFSLDGMTATMTILDQARQLTLALEQLRLSADDLLLRTGHLAYHDGLRIYGNLQTQSRGKVAGAKPLYDELSPFFAKRRRRSEDTKPTQHELERDFHRLTRGTADGEMIIRNESPHATGGVHEIVDDVHKR